MIFTTQRLAFCLLLAFTSFCNPATAELVLNFSTDDGANFSNSFDAQVGDSLTIGIYLQQTDSDTILTSDGLVSWGFDLAHDMPGLGNISNASADSFFDVENHNVLTASGFEWEYGTTTMAGVQGNSIALGSFQFNPTANGTTNFTIEDRIIGTGFTSANWFTPSFSNLDEQVFGPGAAGNHQFTVNASAVPEPSSFVMLGSVAVVSVLRRRWRSKSRSNPTSAQTA